MDFRELKYVMAIAKNKSITKAASELYISQPSLSKFLMNLEDSMGTMLFSRLNNKLEITYAGERYIEYGKKILNIKNELDNELSDIGKSKIGRIRLGIPMISSTYIVCQAIPEFMILYPNVTIDLFEEPTGNLIDLLHNGDLDYAIINEPTDSSDFETDLICRDEFVLIAPREHPIKDKSIIRDDCKYPWIDMKNLQDERFVTSYIKQSSGKIENHLFYSAGFKPKIIITTRNIRTAVQLSAKLGVLTFCTESDLQSLQLKDKSYLYSVGNPNTVLNLVVCYIKGTYLPKYAKDLIDIIKKTY